MTSQTPDKTPLCRQVATLAFAALLVCAGVASPAAATDERAAPSFVVSLHEDGSADVTLTMAFDLTSEEERRAFDRLKQNDENVTARFREQLSRVAAETGEVVGRQMRISDATASFETVGASNTGVVELSATWTNLTRVEGGAFVLSEPFASGFKSDRRFVVHGPNGYRFDGATPEPTASERNRATWRANTNLSDFEARFVPIDDSTEAGGDRTDSSTYGPTPLPGVLLAFAVTAALAGARRRSAR